MNVKVSTKIIIGDSRNMKEVPDDSVHLIVTSPPYFNAKTYSDDFSGRDLGNINDYKKWKDEIRGENSLLQKKIKYGKIIFKSDITNI